MSALYVVGKIVGVVEKEIKPRFNSPKQFDPFKVITYYVMNGGDSAPLKVVGAEETPKYKIDQEVSIPVWFKVNHDKEKQRVYSELREVRSR